MNSANREKSLPDERYDEKLFKQAYKAGIEAKELEKKNIRKKNIIKVIPVAEIYPAPNFPRFIIKVLATYELDFALNNPSRIAT